LLSSGSAAATSGSMDIGSIISSVAGGIVMAVMGMIKKMMSN